MRVKAKLIVSEKFVFDDGAIRQIVIWLVPQPISPSTHSLKYRLAYVVNGKRQVGYDNERGKGDHFHFGDSEFKYAFRGIDQLLANFGEAIRITRILPAGREGSPLDQPLPVAENGGEVVNLMRALRDMLSKEQSDEG